MKIINRNGHKAYLWQADDYKTALQSLRSDKRFFGFDSASGYNLNKGLTSTQKRNIKRAMTTRDYLDTREKLQTIYYHTPLSLGERRELEKSVGKDSNITFSHLRKIPVIIPPGVGKPDIKYDKKSKSIAIQYRAVDLQVIHVPIDYKAAYRAIIQSRGLEGDETELQDAFITEITNQLYPHLIPYQDGRSFFRLATFAGDIGGGNVRAYQTVENLLIDLDMELQKYFETYKARRGDATGGMRINAISIHRRTGGEEMTRKQENIALADYHVRTLKSQARAAKRKKKSGR